MSIVVHPIGVHGWRFQAAAKKMEPKRRNEEFVKKALAIPGEPSLMHLILSKLMEQVRLISST
jgi:hypothetical protein